jgi:hypothetical protein
VVQAVERCVKQPLPQGNSFFYTCERSSKLPVPNSFVGADFGGLFLHFFLQPKEQAMEYSFGSMKFRTASIKRDSPAVKILG